MTMPPTVFISLYADDIEDGLYESAGFDSCHFCIVSAPQ